MTCSQVNRGPEAGPLCSQVQRGPEAGDQLDKSCLLFCWLGFNPASPPEPQSGLQAPPPPASPHGYHGIGLREGIGAASKARLPRWFKGLNRAVPQLLHQSRPFLPPRARQPRGRGLLEARGALGPCLSRENHVEGPGGLLDGGQGPLPRACQGASLLACHHRASSPGRGRGMQRLEWIRNNL